ncbi:spore coat protein [Alicyclobacillus contaminans]|uniref:spore coat protein n=1 Tax=Alicyclobacillus contaminans TaxID=392016 RepID=UPI000406F52F|nr:spore coat protein [Alicyclobacillus contaminans]GMA50037.1 spore coat protein [Alicyclobacillus contaminans]
MSLMTHEACELSELLMSCVNSINSMGLFLNQAKDPTLKGIVQKHMAAHIQDYNMKVEWVTKSSSTQQLQVPSMPSATNGGTNKLPQAVMPNPNLTAPDDRAIATSYLLTLKRAGREYAWAAFETSNPQLRKFLEDAFTMCSRHAFEVGEYMMKQGWYPAAPAQAPLLQEIQQTFQPVREMAAVH